MFDFNELNPEQQQVVRSTHPRILCLAGAGTGKTMTLTVAIYSEVIRSNFGNAAAYSTILTLTSIVSLLLFFKISGGEDISV